MKNKLKWLKDPILMPNIPIHIIECTQIAGRWRVAIIHMVDGKESLRIEKMADTIPDVLEEFSWMMKPAH